MKFFTGDRACFVLWGLVVVLLATTIALQIQVIKFTNHVEATHPEQNEMLEQILGRLPDES